MSFASQSPKADFWKIQNEILAFWKQNKVFEQSIRNREGGKAFRFYDGPPFITGTPHYGTLLSSIAKDVIPRYQTMKGKQVERVRGRDCHGIYIEQKVQKELNLKTSDIEGGFGVENFIKECYRYTKDNSAEWNWYVENIGRWVDMYHAYKTQDNDYMESVLRVFKQLREKDLIYEGKRVSMYSPKLATPISNFEVAMDDTYEDINDPAITVAYDLSVNGSSWENTFILIWTTTPWTIPANMAS
ncbi:MAG: class I tRNA ligase family protein [bacterium]|nr:class I tRNA ligase family protein [bacterium]